MNRRLRALERRIVDKDFRSSAPPLDEDGMPCWGGTPGLSVESYTKALGASPDEELTGEELETRKRLAPFADLFERMEREKAGGEDVA